MQLYRNAIISQIFNLGRCGNLKSVFLQKSFSPETLHNFSLSLLRKQISMLYYEVLEQL